MTRRPIHIKEKRGRGWKFRNTISTDESGDTFHSNRERERHQYLMKRQQCGEIRNLMRQVKFKMCIGDRCLKIRSDGFPNGRTVTYTADHTYDEKHGDEWLYIVEDTKSNITRSEYAYKLKRAMMEYFHGIIIREH